jgi:hypothetical protein
MNWKNWMIWRNWMTRWRRVQCNPGSLACDVDRAAWLVIPVAITVSLSERSGAAGDGADLQSTPDKPAGQCTKEKDYASLSQRGGAEMDRHTGDMTLSNDGLDEGGIG